MGASVEVRVNGYREANGAKWLDLSGKGRNVNLLATGVDGGVVFLDKGFVEARGYTGLVAPVAEPEPEGGFISPITQRPEHRVRISRA